MRPQDCPFCIELQEESHLELEEIPSQDLDTNEEFTAFAIYCYCGLNGPVRDTEVEAIQAWNRINLS